MAAQRYGAHHLTSHSDMGPIISTAAVDAVIAVRRNVAHFALVIISVYLMLTNCTINGSICFV